MPHRPRTPLLPRSTKRKTPKLGVSRCLRKPLSDTLPSRVLVEVAEELLSQPQVIKLEDVMYVAYKREEFGGLIYADRDLKLVIEKDVHSGMIEYHQGIPFLARPGKARSLPKHAEDFTRSTSPAHERKLTIMSPPLFPRHRKAPERNTDDFSLKECLLAPVPLMPVKVEAIDPDIADENMAIVGGWSTSVFYEAHIVTK